MLVGIPQRKEQIRNGYKHTTKLYKTESKRPLKNIDFSFLHCIEVFKSFSSHIELGYLSQDRSEPFFRGTFGIPEID